MAILLQGDPNNPLGGNAGSAFLGQPYSTQMGGASPDSNLSFNVPLPASLPTPAATVVKPSAPVTPRVSMAAPVASGGATFYKPDPNSQQVFNAQGQALSYDQFIAQGGRADFSNVLKTAFPGQPAAQPAQVAQPAQTFGFGDGQNYDINGQPVQKQGASPVPTTPPALPATDPNQTRIGELTKQVFQAPTVNQQKLYETAYNTAGLSAVRTKLEDLNKVISDKLADYTSKEGDINENPFLSEATRTGRLRRLNDQKQAEIGNLQEQYKSYADLYNNGVDEVNKSVERQVGDFNTQRQVSSEELNYLLGIENAKTTQQATAEKTAATFAEKNNITARFYKYPGNNTVYDSRTGQPLNFDQYKALGGAGNAGAAFPDVQTIQGELKTISEGQSLYDPTTGKVVATVPKTYKPGSGGGGAGSFSVVGADGKVLKLTNTQIDNISPITTQFKNEPIVQNFNIIAEGYQFVSSLSNNTTNPSDDQALIYALAKALDPGSVVREGEYATAQKYSQSWINSYGKSVTQALSGTGFLSEQARKNIKDTIKSRFTTAQKNYENIFAETARRIELVGNTPAGTGSQFLTNYAGGYAATQPTSQQSSSVNLNDLF